MVNYLDICPKYAGFVFAIANTLSSVAGFGSPYLMGLMTEDVRKKWEGREDALKYYNPLAIFRKPGMHGECTSM